MVKLKLLNPFLRYLHKNLLNQIDPARQALAIIGKLSLGFFLVIFTFMLTLQSSISLTVNLLIILI